MGERNTLRCWWFGCEQHPQDPSPVEYVTCMHCGETISYSDLVGDTRHMRFMEWLSRFNPRQLFPAKCTCCGGRYKHDDSVDHVPF